MALFTSSFKGVVFIGLHRELSHAGIEKTIWLIRQIGTGLEEYVARC